MSLRVNEPSCLEPSLYDRIANTISDRDASDILIAAVEGGTGYWAMVDDYIYSDDLTRTYLIDIETNKPYYVMSNSLIWKRAIVKAAGEFGMHLKDFIEDHDAGSADVVAQIYCFGEVIYG